MSITNGSRSFVLNDTHYVLDIIMPYEKKADFHDFSFQNL